MRLDGLLALALAVVSTACGGEKQAEPSDPLASVVAHLREHGFRVAEVPARGDPPPVAAAVVRLKGGTAAIYVYGSETSARTAAAVFAREEQAAPQRVRVQRDGGHVFVGRAAPGSHFPALDFEDVVFTSEAED